MRFLITGGRSEIGKASARALYRAGHEIIVTASTEESLSQLQSEFFKEDIQSEYLLFNFIDYEKSSEALEALLVKPIDSLILNACTKLNRLKRFADLKLEDSLRYIDQNLHGNLFLLHRIIKEQTKHKLGRNVFISSVSATMGTSRYASYCLVKSGMEGLFRNLAVDYGSMNIFFNSLRPGIIATSRHEDVRARKGYEDAIVSKIPAAVLGSPEHVARSVLLLVEQNSYINGTHLEVSGGLPMFRIGDV